MTWAAVAGATGAVVGGGIQASGAKNAAEISAQGSAEAARQNLAQYDKDTLLNLILNTPSISGGNIGQAELFNLLGLPQPVQNFPEMARGIDQGPVGLHGQDKGTTGDYRVPYRVGDQVAKHPTLHGDSSDSHTDEMNHFLTSGALQDFYQQYGDNPTDQQITSFITKYQQRTGFAGGGWKNKHRIYMEALLRNNKGKIGEIAALNAPLKPGETGDLISPLAKGLANLGGNPSRSQWENWVQQQRNPSESQWQNWWRQQRGQVGRDDLVAINDELGLALSKEELDSIQGLYEGNQPGVPYKSEREQQADKLAARVASLPGYEFAKDEAIDAIMSQQSALGLRESGTTVKAIGDRVAQGLSFPVYQDYKGDLQNIAGLGATTSANLGTNLGNLGQNFAGLNANLLQAEADARASGILGASGAYQNTANQLGTILGDYFKNTGGATGGYTPATVGGQPAQVPNIYAPPDSSGVARKYWGALPS